MGLTGSISRGFLYGLNRTEVVGLDRFLETLDRRRDVEGRERGLITGTVSSGKLPIRKYADRIALNSFEPCQCVCDLRSLEISG